MFRRLFFPAFCIWFLAIAIPGCTEAKKTSGPAPTPQSEIPPAPKPAGKPG